MTQIQWRDHPKLDKRLLELNFQNLTYAEIIDTLNEEFQELAPFTFDQVRNRLRRCRARKVSIKDYPETVLMPYFEKYRAVIEGTSPYPQKIEMPDLSKGKIKILHISDTHIPFQDDEALEYAVNTNLTADIVVVGGDLNDCYALSRFEKEANVPFESEIEGILRFNEWISACFPGTPIIQMSGNHHKRIKRNVAYPLSLSFLYDQDFYYRMASPFPNIITVDSWFYQVNDALFLHDERHSGSDGRSVVQAYEYFRESAEFLNLTNFSVVVQAHTHQVCAAYRYGKKLLESGALCKALPYSYASSRYRKPQACGYVTLVQENGKSILNECREHYIVPRLYEGVA